MSDCTDVQGPRMVSLLNRSRNGPFARLPACAEGAIQKGPLHERWRPGYYPQPMARPIAGRIAELRKEIARIQALNARESNSDPYENREAVRQRRAERLQEIMDELRGLIEWKQP